MMNDSCVDMFYGEDCSLPWSDLVRTELGVAQLVVPVLFGLFAVVNAAMVVPQMFNRRKRRGGFKFMHTDVVVLATFFGNVSFMVFFLLGNGYRYPIYTPLGKASGIISMVSTGMFFSAAVAVLYLLQKVNFDRSQFCANDVPKHLMKKPFHPIVYATVPYGLVLLVLTVAVIFEMVDSPTVATRLNAGGAIVPTFLFVVSYAIVAYPIYKWIKKRDMSQTRSSEQRTETTIVPQLAGRELQNIKEGQLLDLLENGSATRTSKELSLVIDDVDNKIQSLFAKAAARMLHIALLNMFLGTLAIVLFFVVTFTDIIHNPANFLRIQLCTSVGFLFVNVAVIMLWCQSSK